MRTRLVVGPEPMCVIDAAHQQIIDQADAEADAADGEGGMPAEIA